MQGVAVSTHSPSLGFFSLLLSSKSLRSDESRSSSTNDEPIEDDADAELLMVREDFLSDS